ncbi:23S rRNA (guanosine(2251)-2'-O)-methyltransferase RlmB [Candidatus Pacebacteria bacterium]|nr:23S rRNA (guanosine(2251)-2'-O)-methyltransferase RlmB [Candidatus Paceibacterota bacterium]
MRKDDDLTYIYGKNAVIEALTTRPDTISKIFLVDKSTGDKHLINLMREAKIEASHLNEKNLPGRLEGHVSHQGVVAEISTKKLMPSYKDFIDNLEVTDKTALLIFGEVQDPQNVGAAIRSAAAFGISGVLVPSHNQAPINGTVVKVSAGMAFRVPLVSIKNVNTTIEDLKKKGFWIYGLDGEGETSLPDEQFEQPTVFVIGNEGQGLRKLTSKVCDTLLSIPIDPKCESMNASASVAVALYGWSVKKRK